MKRADWSIVVAPILAIYGRFWAQTRWMLLGIAAVVFAAAIGNVATPYVFSRLIDRLDGGQVPVALALMFVAYALLRGATTALAYSVNFMSVIAAENLNFIAATSFFERLLRKSSAFFIEHNPAEIQTARDQGENSIYVLVQLGIIVFIPGMTQIALALILLGAVINFEIVGIVAVYGAAFIALTYGANQWTRPLLDRAIEANQDNAKFVGNAVNAMETLRYFNGDRWIGERFAQKSEVARASWVGWAQRRMLLASVFGLALAAQLAVTFWVLLPRFAQGELSVGDIVLINMLLIQLNQPFEMIGTAIDDVMRSISKFLPFARMWAAPEDKAADDGEPLVLQSGELRFEDVSFAYGDKSVVSGVSFTAQRGQVTFLTGPTGAGKSTLFKLALKAIEPHSGRVLVDGVDLADIGRESWYRSVGVVTQDVMLLNDTLGANIVLGRKRDEAQLRVVAAKAHILAFIDTLPDGFETSVGERGLKLSGGERQRVAIARALYGEPKVLLLDEASSALDEGTEAQIMAELRELDETVTILAITHRKSVIVAEDKVVRLRGGSRATEPHVGHRSTPF